MKLIYTLIAAAISAPALATNVPAPATPTQYQNQNQHQAQDQNIGSIQPIATGGEGGVATGGAGGAGGVATGGTAGNAVTGGAQLSDNSRRESKTSAFAIALPAPVGLPQMSEAKCPGTEITQSSKAVGWNFVSTAEGRTDTSSCLAVEMYNAYIRECQFASAKQVRDLLTAKVLPGFKASDAGYFDLTPDECTALRTPAPAPTVINLISEPIAQAAPAPAVCEPAPQPKRAKPRAKAAAVKSGCA